MKVIIAITIAAAAWVGQEPDPAPAAQSAEAIVRVPSRPTPGHLIQIDATASRAKSFKWKQVPAEPAGLAVDDGRRYVFAAPAGRFTIFLSVAAGDSVDSEVVEIDLGNPDRPDNPPEPSPPPDPGPPSPGPGPALPEGRFDLARAAHALALSHVTAPTQSRRDGAQALAASFRGFKKSIEGNELTLQTIDQICDRTFAWNRQILGPNAPAWSNWGDELAGRLASLEQSGQIKSKADVAEAWGEIATGLEAVPAK